MALSVGRLAYAPLLSGESSGLEECMRVPRLALVALALALSAGAALPGVSDAQDCACRDANHNGVCDGGEATIPRATWFGPGPLDVRPDSFTIPESCDFLLGGVNKPVQVTAANHFLFGNLNVAGNGGQGVLFIADNNIVVGDVTKPRVEWRVPGQNKLIDKQPANTAIAKASIGFKTLLGSCAISNAYLEAQPIGGSAQIGMQCAGDIVFRNADLFTSGFDIQSLNGMIDASNVSSGGPPQSARWCDIDDDGVVDLPCSVSTADQLSSVCTGSPEFPVPTPGAGAGVNKIRGVANPAVMVAKTGITVRSDSAAVTSQNVLEGRYSLTLIAEDGDIDLTNAKLSNTTNFQSGSRLWAAANPGRVERFVFGILKEKFFEGCTGQITFSEGTCFHSPNPPRVCGSTAGAGPSSTPPCRDDLDPVVQGGGG
jgi:hypothetical protein